MPRTRGNNEGSVVEHKGRAKPFEVRVTLDGSSKSCGYFRTRREANTHLREVLAERNQGLDLAQRGQTLSQWLKYWLEDVKRGIVSDRTFWSYDEYLRHAVEVLGDIPLHELTSQDIRSFYADLNLSPSSITTLHTILKQSLQFAEDEGAILKNPARRVHPPRIDRMPKDIFSVEEIRAIFESSRGTDFHALWVLLFATGLRRGEACALMWESVGDNYVVVQQTVTYDPENGHRIGPPKTKNSRRRVDLPPTAQEALREHRVILANRMQRALDRGERWENASLVFPRGNGELMTGSSLSNYWRTALKRAGVRYRSPHTTRHTFGSLLSESGVHIQHVQGAMRHANVETTLKFYSHLSPTGQQQVVTRIEELIGR